MVGFSFRVGQGFRHFDSASEALVVGLLRVWPTANHGLPNSILAQPGSTSETQCKWNHNMGTASNGAKAALSVLVRAVIVMLMMEAIHISYILFATFLWTAWRCPGLVTLVRIIWRALCCWVFAGPFWAAPKVAQRLKSNLNYTSAPLSKRTF